MTLTQEELTKVDNLQRQISGAYKAAKDVREIDLRLSDDPVWKYCRQYRLQVGEIGYAELERLVTEELIPPIRELVPDYANPFNPHEFEEGEEIPF